jgi:hypothetical protein
MPSRLRLRLAAVVAVVLLLAACAQRTPLPAALPTLVLPQQWHVQQHGVNGEQDWLLVIQQEPNALRWSLFDPLGVPLARQLLRDGAWQHDGLLPPNPQARELFAAHLFALTPHAELARAWPAGSWQSEGPVRRLQHGQARWQVRYQNDRHFTLWLGDDSRYLLRLLQGAAP